ncbi:MULTISPECIES: hypothetical protein [Bradyrhizobium]|jgi:hypothetical protein|uniref:hypothetical protein n=1 Tax=Bradyrhizobium TaxID=374 RepID=UPI0004B2BDFA|nr:MULTISPECIES: hypothetical protein [Bradyrhizobium]MCS3447391.1 hypothetical protein [Bradyrhizobium elkanii]MCS3561470.1 hypothetical protein [Bradyrhizobium elkanii]MCW2148687.1 hypothetical protein [Bradyrhizobium elkanii]MCW2352228.1 hypothetical protein [Bradyrhizobium elkanii]MCW2372416.1 hypothetical protein [Bradyrhizobium elkanii]
MPKENDLEGQQDQGGKNGGQKRMPKPEPKPKGDQPDLLKRPGSTPPPTQE